MQKTWIIAAESSRARIFTVSSPSSPLEELETLAHPESRLHERNMVSDLPGKHADKDGRQRGSGHHAFQEKIEPKDQELIYFAKWLADHLTDAHNKAITNASSSSLRLPCWALYGRGCPSASSKKSYSKWTKMSSLSLPKRFASSYRHFFPPWIKASKQEGAICILKAGQIKKQYFSLPGRRKRQRSRAFQPQTIAGRQCLAV